MIPVPGLTQAQVSILAGWTAGTGTIGAVVQPRAGLLVDLLALAGVAGETSYPTDYPEARVYHNGVAGEAVVNWSGGGATILKDMTGLDAYVVPAGVSIGSLTLIGTPSDNVTVSLSTGQQNGTFSVLNAMAGGFTFNVDGSADVASSDGQTFTCATNSNTSAKLVNAVGTTFGV